MKNIWSYLLILSGLVFVAAMIFMSHQLATEKKKVEKFEQFCLATKMAMGQDYRAFESGDPKKQEEALNRFYESHELYHGSESIMYCIGEGQIPDMPAECQLSPEKNWNCLADIAKKIESML